MKRDDVKVDGTYLAKVGGGVVPVRITGEKWTGNKHTGWVGVNTQTNRSVRIKTAQRLRGPVEGQEADAGATTPDAAEGAASPAANATAAAPAKAGKGGGKGGAKGRGSLKAAAAADQHNARMRDEREASPDGMTASERAMAQTATPAAKPAAKEPKAAKAPKEPKPKKTSALDAAAIVLADARTPMKPKDMIATMESKGLWTSPGGKTPEATLYAAIIREISAKGREARFRKTERGTFIATEHAGAATTAADAGTDDRCPKCGAEQRGQPITDPDGRLVCGECGHAYDAKEAA